MTFTDAYLDFFISYLYLYIFYVSFNLDSLLKQYTIVDIKKGIYLKKKIDYYRN